MLIDNMLHMQNLRTVKDDESQKQTLCPADPSSATVTRSEVDPSLFGEDIAWGMFDPLVFPADERLNQDGGEWHEPN